MRGWTTTSPPATERTSDALSDPSPVGGSSSELAAACWHGWHAHAGIGGRRGAAYDNDTHNPDSYDRMRIICGADVRRPRASAGRHG